MQLAPTTGSSTHWSFGNRDLVSVTFRLSAIEPLARPKSTKGPPREGGERTKNVAGVKNKSEILGGAVEECEERAVRGENGIFFF